jgi:hypothetical protein
MEISGSIFKEGGVVGGGKQIEWSGSSDYDDEEEALNQMFMPPPS